MPSYTQYMRQMAVLDAKDDDIESWITVRGNHIPIKKGQSKEDAVKSFIEKKGGSGEKKAEPKYDPEFETVRKNALANSSLYGGRYTQKSKAKAYEEYKKDTEKPKNTFLSNPNTLKEFANHFGISESVAKAASEKFGDSFYNLMTKDPTAGVGIATNYKDYTKEDVEKHLQKLNKKDTEKKSESKESGKSEPKQYTFHYDAGHGWLEVPKEDVEELGIEVSSASYSDGKNVYLEEDLDAQTFAKAYEKKYGVKHKEINHNDGDYSRIRNMGGYKPEKAKETSAKKSPEYESFYNNGFPTTGFGDSLKQDISVVKSEKWNRESEGISFGKSTYGDTGTYSTLKISDRLYNWMKGDENKIKNVEKHYYMPSKYDYAWENINNLGRALKNARKVDGGYEIDVDTTTYSWFHD